MREEDRPKRLGRTNTDHRASDMDDVQEEERGRRQSGILVHLAHR